MGQLSQLFLGLALFISTSIFAAQGAAYDAQFLDKMTEHHKQGVEMAKLAIEKAQSRDVKKMSEKMVKVQTNEIGQMTKWRKSDFKSAPQAADLPPKMDMQPLKNASGSDFDHQYLAMMTKHHEDGITMAQDAKENAETGKIKKFATDVEKKQSSEKAKMEKMMASMNH